MDKTDNTPAVNSAPGTVPMARIDGAAIRRLRESKGLTQLYLATVIGVTTDTISRWENRRYPSIKLDNAERLAQALAVELQAILEQGPAEEPPAVAPRAAEEVEAPPLPSEPPPPPAEPAPAAAPAAASTEPPRRPSPPWHLLLILLAAVGGLVLWWLTPPAPPGMTVVAERILPDHIPAGQTFPVLIRVTTSQPGSVSLILKEGVPPGCRAGKSGEPPFTSVDAKGGALKWISRTDKQVTTFAYLVQSPAKAADDDQLRFHGEVTLNQRDQTQAAITGAATITIAPYHWADLDGDNAIDDEEILAVYDRYSILTELDFDRDLIDAIWAASGYAWERKTGKYVVEK